MLRKPSEYFGKDKPSIETGIHELVKKPEMNTFSDAFESFKNNLSKIEVLSNFSETLDNYKINIERVNHLSSSIEDIKSEIHNLLKKEDMDRAMMSQLFVVEQSICDVQSKVQAINEKNLTDIRLDVFGLTKSVNEFLEIEVPKYKKLVVESELRTNDRYEKLEENVNQTLENIGEFVENKYQQLTETLEGINQNSLSSILKEFTILENSFQKFVNEDIPKYKSFIVETERKTEQKIGQFDDKLLSTLIKIEENVNQSIDKNYSSVIKEIENLENNFVKIKEQDIPKYKSFIVETEIKTESKIKDFQNKFDETIFNVLEKITLIEDDKSDLVNQVVQKIQDVKQLNEEVCNELKNNEIYKNDLNEKISDLQLEIVRNESHIKIQNKNLQEIQEEVKKTLSKINIEEVEKQNYELGKRIKYLEEVFDKFSEKEILTENLLVEPPSVDNKDPLTPLDKNFVTIEQLQEHYRLFINRVQQQLATIGGGGETRLRYLDDIVGIATNSSAYDGKYLQWNSTINKAEFVTVTGIGSTGTIQVNSDWNSTTGISSILNKPVIPEAQINSDWNSTTGISSILNKPSVVNKIIAGSNIVISPSNGTGTVTINASGGVGSATTGYYGSFYDTTNQVSAGTTAKNVVAIGQTAEAYAVSIVDGSKIKVDNYGVYNIQFSFQLGKTNASTDTIDIWIAKNGSDVPYTDSQVTIQGAQLKDIPAWNFVLTLNAGDYIQFYWSSSDANLALQTIAAGSNPTRPVSPSVIVTVTQVSSALLGSPVQTLDQTLGYGNISSLGMSVGDLTVSKIISTDGGSFSGVVTATSFSGSGLNLTGVVTSISAGAGISITSSGGISTITNTAITLNQTLTAGNTSTLGMSVGVTTVTTLNVTSNATPTVKPVYISGSPNGSSLTYGVLNVGGVLNYSDIHNNAVFVENVNSYTQVVLQNTNSGNNASTDFIVSNDLSGATNYYGDFGINASGFTGGGVWDDPNGTYLYASAGSLSIGTDDAKDFRIATGISTNNPVTRVTVKGTTGYVGINSTAPQYGLDVNTSAHFGDGFYDSTHSLGATNAILSNTGVSSATKWITNPSFSALTVNNGGINVTGVVTASSFSGSGSSLTGIVTSITAGSGISINQSTGNVTITATGSGVTSGSNTSYTGNNTFSGITTFSGNVTSTAILKVEQVQETYNPYNTTIGAGTTVALDCSTGNTFFITSTVNGNWTANLTNLGMFANCLTNVTLLISQGTTPYLPTTLQIGGVSHTINWQGGSLPSGSNSKKDAIAFTIFYDGSTYTVFGQLVTFG